MCSGQPSSVAGQRHTAPAARARCAGLGQWAVHGGRGITPSTATGQKGRKAQRAVTGRSPPEAPVARAQSGSHPDEAEGGTSEPGGSFPTRGQRGDPQGSPEACSAAASLHRRQEPAQGSREATGSLRLCQWPPSEPPLALPSGSHTPPATGSPGLGSLTLGTTQFR